MIKKFVLGLRKFKIQNHYSDQMQSIFDSFSDATLRRLFKFVLKRSIGRFLCDELALEQVTVSSRQGVLSIIDLIINPIAINEEFFASSPLQLRRCTIKRLESAISYSSLLKDGFKISFHGVEIELEPNTTSHSAPSSSSSRKSNSNSNEVYSDSKIHNPGQTNPTVSDDTKSIDTSGLGFLVEWVEVLVLSIQASVHDVKISIAASSSTSSPFACEIHVSDILYVNAGNSQINHETSVSEASKLNHSNMNMKGSTSILHEKLLKVSVMFTTMVITNLLCTYLM
jgi:hypothetical protein